MNSLANFCDKNEIKWFPISLTITRVTDEVKGVKTLNPIQHHLYNGRPKMTDFKTLTSETIKQRQELLKDTKWAKQLNCIAMDTSRVYHIDIDTPDYDKNWDWVMEEQKCPYFKSMTKSYGRHIMVTSDYMPEKLRVQLKEEGVELLSGQWSYAPNEIFNGDNDPTDVPNLKEMLVIEPKKSPKSPTTITQGINSDDEAPTRPVRQTNNKSIKYEEVEAHANNISVEKFLTTGKYDDWIHIVWALRRLGDDSYKTIAENLAQRCSRDVNEYVTHYWNNYDQKSSLLLLIDFYIM